MVGVKEGRMASLEQLRAQYLDACAEYEVAKREMQQRYDDYKEAKEQTAKIHEEMMALLGDLQAVRTALGL